MIPGLDPSVAMVNRRIFPFLIVGIFLALGPVPAAAQVPNIDTVEGPSSGEKTTLMQAPRSVAEGLSVRAWGVRSPDSTRWALTLIGASPDDSVALTFNGDQLPVLKVSGPEDGEVGPVQVYISQEAFLTIANNSGVRLRVGDTTATFPPVMRKEMQMIFDQVT